ncbi:MAG: hypothetical protein A2078_06400 [Nitrospirae bacterium GWC2_57_9]|nr:MAG: hypothetical protein A2078_06400 [Nitrospirae bacterium GWC2_57_9]
MITLLGATGNVGSRIAGILAGNGEKVRLVARDVGRLRRMVGRRAEAMAGDARDVEFLAKAFQGSDAVFTLIPPDSTAERFLDYADAIGGSIARALEIARVGHVVNLSSVGADLPDGTGPIVGLHRQEERLNRIDGLNVLHLRAAYFMENLLMNIGLIRTQGINGSAIRGDVRMPMVATLDIASYAAERLQKRDFAGASVRYLLGRHDITMLEATMTVGIKIGKPNLPYVVFPYADAEQAMVKAGLSPDMSRLYIEMSKAFNDGRVKVRRTAGNTTPTSFEEFCDQVFVPRYMEKKAA